MMNSDSTERHRTAHDTAVIVRFLVSALIVAALVIVALDNREDVRVGYAVGETEAPIWIVLVIAALAGVVIGWLLKHRPHRN